MSPKYCIYSQTHVTQILVYIHKQSCHPNTVYIHKLLSHDSDAAFTAGHTEKLDKMTQGDRLTEQMQQVQHVTQILYIFINTIYIHICYTHHIVYIYDTRYMYTYMTHKLCTYIYGAHTGGGCDTHQSARTRVRKESGDKGTLFKRQVFVRFRE